MELFMIRKNGLFSTGGRYASWEKKGKTWESEKNAQKAIDYYNRDQESYFKYAQEDAVKEIARLEKNLTKPLTEKDRKDINKEINRLKKLIKSKPDLSFYKKCEIIKIGVPEN